MTVKEQLHKIADELPEDASWADAEYRFQFFKSVEKGLIDVEKGKTVSTEEAKKRLFARFKNIDL